MQPSCQGSVNPYLPPPACKVCATEGVDARGVPAFPFSWHDFCFRCHSAASYQIPPNLAPYPIRGVPTRTSGIKYSHVEPADPTTPRIRTKHIRNLLTRT